MEPTTPPPPPTTTTTTTTTPTPNPAQPLDQIAKAQGCKDLVAVRATNLPQAHAGATEEPLDTLVVRGQNLFMSPETRSCAHAQEVPADLKAHE